MKKGVENESFAITEHLHFHFCHDSTFLFYAA